MLLGVPQRRFSGVERNVGVHRHIPTIHTESDLRVPQRRSSVVKERESIFWNGLFIGFYILQSLRECIGHVG
ncbi:hypothetical protein PGT21_007323 [Puccinia graminis f. sp. tritici]|uniref:Uncharacterized protein n=1 Tax=Puccinia graminis f. sp. tritici TaxID=56615 RepID=A0A5B0MAT1_PUCGR|nr:hypothetical protein PGT21_007323 [Puccinia graminis f. sp. tritici]